MVIYIYNQSVNKYYFKINEKKNVKKNIYQTYVHVFSILSFFLGQVQLSFFFDNLHEIMKHLFPE